MARLGTPSFSLHFTSAKKTSAKSQSYSETLNLDLIENVPISSRLKSETLSDVPQLKGTYTKITQL